MSNETQTPETQSASDHAESPHSSQGTNGSNGFDSVAAQYRAMQEAQLLHEETINQLREEIRGQREKIAELIRTTPNAKGGQVDVVMMRLTELERKIGEGAPDPLINEIVHRLAALENNGPVRGAKDPRVDEVYKQMDGLRQQIENAGGSDSRTDDVVLRIASLEGAFRRAAQSRDPEEVQARIDKLAKELSSRQEAELAELRAGFAEAAKAAAGASASTDESASSEALAAVSERLQTLEKRLESDGAQEQLSAFGRQLAELDRKLAAQSNTEIETRVSNLEERAAQPQSSEEIEKLEGRLHNLEERVERPQPAPGLEEIATRVSALEQKLNESGEGPDPEHLARLEAKVAELASSPETEKLRERVEALAAQVTDSDVSPRLLELAGRVRALEASTKEDPPAVDLTRLEELGERITRLEESEASKEALAEIARFEKELRAVQSVSQAPAAPGAGNEELLARLDELEDRVSDAESSSRLEDAHARLKDLETKWSTLGEPAEIGRRLTVLEMDSEPKADPRVEDLVQRLAALEAKPFESVSDQRVQELGDSVAKLRSELETVSQERLPVLTELPERLARVESNLREVASAAARSAAAPVAQEAAAELRQQLQALGGKLEEVANRPAPQSIAQDPRVSELTARLEWVERKASDLPDPSDLNIEELTKRLEAVEKSLSSGAGGDSLSSVAKAEIAARLAALEEAAAASQDHGQSGKADVEALLRKETERWNQWARSTIDEIGEIRGRLDGVGRAGAGLDAESVEALSIQITNSLNNSEAKALRAQMYFVYLSIGVLWALVLYLMFAG